MNGPDWLSKEIVKNGSLSRGKARYKCKNCGQQLVLNPQKSRISEETRA